MDAELRQRAKPVPDPVPAPNLAAGITAKATTKVPAGEEHPSGKESHGKAIQILRGVSFAVFFLSSCVT